MEIYLEMQKNKNKFTKKEIIENNLKIIEYIKIQNMNDFILVVLFHH